MPDVLNPITTEKPSTSSHGGLRALAAWAPAVLVAMVWLAMLVSDLYFIRAYGRNVPYWEDWEFVPRLTVEKVDAAWLFGQHVEHRVPLPKLILFVLFKATNLDFRAGLYFNVFGLALVALALILAARQVRGRTSYADVVFPLLLLNWGHWNNLVWNWQVQFITSTLVGTVLLLLILFRGDRPTIGTALAVGICLVLLPLCGANGVALTPLAALWLGGAGAWSLMQSERGAKSAGTVALLFAATALALTAGYGMGLQQSTLVAKRPGFMPAAATFVAFLGAGFGRYDKSAVLVREALLPVAAWIGMRLWLRRPLQAKEFVALAFSVLLARGLQYQCESEHLPLPIPSRRTTWGIVAMAVTGICVWLLARNLIQRRGERLRSAGLLAFLGGLAALGIGLAWGRAGALSDVHDTPRYYTLAVALPCTVFLILELYAPSRLLLLARPLLVVAALVMAWGNIHDGSALADLRVKCLDGFRQDLHAGLPADVIVSRQRVGGVFVPPLVPIDYGRCLLLLRDAGHPEFQHVADNPPRPGGEP